MILNIDGTKVAMGLDWFMSAPGIFSTVMSIIFAALFVFWEIKVTDKDSLTVREGHHE